MPDITCKTFFVAAGFYNIFMCVFSEHPDADFHFDNHHPLNMHSHLFAISDIYSGLKHKLPSNTLKGSEKDQKGITKGLDG